MKRKALEAWHHHLDQHGFATLHYETYAGQGSVAGMVQATEYAASSENMHPSQGRMLLGKKASAVPVSPTPDNKPGDGNE